MERLKLVVTQRMTYKVRTKRKHSDALADNLLNMDLNPVGQLKFRRQCVLFKDW
jgi:putative transposase